MGKDNSKQQKTTLIYGLLWLGLAVLGNINGIARQYLYADVLGDLHAHQLSTLTLIVMSGIMIWFSTKKWPLSRVEAKAVGISWFLMTVAFEFLFGHFVVGHSWARLLYDYNIRAGRVWGLVLLWVIVAPTVFTMIKNRGHDGKKAA